ncbi:AT-hook motif nuclear-localized protein 14-like [Impatiens glandulifera]|uniref:AT-hook motif nuclear-localized protein 14-like n=1 Tax=Impatiens glandulifera TaxID=253017 RepID=UPI001FB19553|nr:AT-hook motif nuclear-localized protein 14-like [Impatiens glandulifera]
MEPDESGLNSYYHHHHPQPSLHHPSSAAAAAASGHVNSPPRNGILLNVDRSSHQLVYSQPSVPSTAVSPPVVEPVRRKRGRPRKYGTPEQAAAAKRLSSSLSGTMSISSPKKREHSLAAGASSSSSYSKKTQQYPGNAGQGFTPHIISVAAGEDIYEKIMVFMQQSKRVMCILSASGSVSNPSLRQPATSGGNVTYEGQFNILSMSGSYIHSEIGGRTGGLSVSLSSADGQIIGGCINGTLRAAGPVMVFVGTFLTDTKKDIGQIHHAKGHDHSSSQTPSSNTPFGGHIFLGSGFD